METTKVLSVLLGRRDNGLREILSVFSVMDRCFLGWVWLKSYVRTYVRRLYTYILCIYSYAMQHIYYINLYIYLLVSKTWIR